MASGLKKFFSKAKSTTEDKPSTTQEDSISTNVRPSSSRPASRKERKENECIRERRVLERERNTHTRRIHMKFSRTQKLYSAELCSPSNSPEKGLCLEQKVPLLTKKSMSKLETCPSRLTGPLDQSSCESVSDSFQEYSEEFSHRPSEISAVTPDDRCDDAPVQENDLHEKYPPQSKKVDSSEVLMNELSHHQIEWAAMMELQKVDPTGILRGLSSRQIRWLVRESRCRTWLVGTLGPLPEERSEAVDLKVGNDLDNLTVLHE